MINPLTSRSSIQRPWQSPLSCLMLLTSSAIISCSNPPPPAPKPPAPPAVNPLPALPQPEQIERIDPNEDPSVLPKPEAAS